MKPLFLLLASAAVVCATPRFSITKSTIDGGGGASVPAGRFTLTGTIGQADAAPRLVSADNRFTVEPGFWNPFVVVPVEGAPELTMQPGSTAGTVVFSWPLTTASYVLEESPDLSAGSWTPVNYPVSETATGLSVIYPQTARRMFFRLRRQ